MKHASLVAAALAVAACGRSEPKGDHAHAPTPAPRDEARAASPAGPGDCAALTGANVVQTEMRRLECALQHAIAAVGRDDLAAIPRWIHVVHEARIETEKALDAGGYAPPGDRAAFVALDHAFHDELEALVGAAAAKDHAGVTAALGRALGLCQGCHATYRPSAPAAPAAPAAVHDH